MLYYIYLYQKTKCYIIYIVKVGGPFEQKREPETFLVTEAKA